MARLLLALALLLGLAAPAVGVDVGDAASLPWEGDAEHGLRLDCDVAKLPRDTLALLGEDVPLLVRYETLRRAAAYLSVRGSAPEVAAPLRAQLQAALDARANGEAPAAVHRLDAASFRHLTGGDVDVAVLAELPLPRAELAYVLQFFPGGQDHLSVAIEQAREGSLLARNLLRDFDHEYESLTALRDGLAPTDRLPGGSMFPEPPPVPDANPAVRYGVTLLAPWRLVVTATDEGTAVTWAKATPWRIRLTQGHHLVIGTRIGYSVHVDGKRRAAHDSEELLGGEPLNATSATSFLQDVPAGALVKAYVQVFETDIPPQHHWSPTSPRYRVLWEHTYETLVP